MQILQALEFEVEIDENHQIHLQLPETVKAGKARVIVLYEESEQSPFPLEKGTRGLNGKLSQTPETTGPFT